MKNLLEIEIGEIWVDGEISNYKCYASGHAYFTLKDAGAQISCVFFKGMAARSRTKPESGMQVRIFGEVSLYESRGQVQLIVKQVEEAGLGDLQAKFEALKRKLEAEGIFDPSIKKPLPKFPQTIGLVTSPNGAALQDILNVLGRRAPWVKVVLYPVQVQGVGAEHGIAKAIAQLGDADTYGHPKCDVLIVGRGGGSLEDLWNFNEEVVARAIYNCPIPLVSAVGHEIDFSICDFASDLRAPTPSAAAELVVPDAEELRGQVAQSSSRMLRVVENRLRHDEVVVASARRALMPKGEAGIDRALREPVMELDRIRQSLRLVAEGELEVMVGQLKDLKVQLEAQHPKRVLQRRAERLEHVTVVFEMAGKSGLQQSEQRLQRVSSMLRALGPEATFARGFSMTMDASGKIVKDASQVKPGEVLLSQFGNGTVKSRVENGDE